MTRILISTTMRNSNIGKPSGYLYVYDLERDQVLRRIAAIESPYRYVDPNPRGGLRGVKGITGNADVMLVANTHSIFVFDRSWSLQRIISHPSCAGIHDILLDGDTLWVTSTRNDLLFEFDLSGHLKGYQYFREDRALQRELDWHRKPLFTSEEILSGAKDYRDPRTHALTRTDSLHLNSICRVPAGGYLISLGLVMGQGFSWLLRIKEGLVRVGVWPWIVAVNHALIRILGRKKDMHSDMVVQPAEGLSAVLKMDPAGRVEPCLVLEKQHVPSHSVAASQAGRAVYLNSNSGDLLQFEIGNSQILARLHVTDKFLRGCLVLSEQELLAGAQNTLVLVDLRLNSILKRIELSEDGNEAVFAIARLPDSFALPPESFEEQVEAYQDLHGQYLAE